jgi:hypothetical protein
MVAVIVGLASVGVAFAAEPASSPARVATKQVATRRAATDPRPVAHVPLDAAVSARARVETEQAMHDAQVAQYLAAVAEYYRPKTNVNWDGIARCETGGNWSMRGASFSGGLGFYNGTWNAFGGREFAANAGLASREQQIVVAERVYARFGLSGWGCRAYG